MVRNKCYCCGGRRGFNTSNFGGVFIINGNEGIEQYVPGTLPLGSSDVGHGAIANSTQEIKC